MKYVDEFRDANVIAKAVEEIRRLADTGCLTVLGKSARTASSGRG